MSEPFRVEVNGTNSSYQVTIKIANSIVSGNLVPHAFVTISGSKLSAPVTIGYYPQDSGTFFGAGTVRNNATSDNGVELPYDRSVTFDISAQQAMIGLTFAANVANNPGQYEVLGSRDKSNIVFADGYQCTGFARDGLNLKNSTKHFLS